MLARFSFGTLRRGVVHRRTRRSTDGDIQGQSHPSPGGLTRPDFHLQRDGRKCDLYMELTKNIVRV